MVTDAILRVLANFVSWLVGLFPHIELPDWLTTITTYVGTVVANAIKLGNWIPWPVIGLAFVFIWGAFGVALGIRVARIVASFFTAGGGSAA